MPKTKNCHFQTEWLRNKKYSSWIKSCVSNNKKAICNWCRTDIDISNMGVSALDSHAAGKKHLGHARTHNAANIFFTGMFPSIFFFGPSTKSEGPMK